MLPTAILAGGLGTRLRPLTEEIPKSLIQVAGRPFIEWQLEWLRKEGVSRVVLCVGHLAYRVEEAVKDGARFNLEVVYSRDGNRLLGTGGALRQALPLLGGAFFVLYGDSLLTCHFASVEAAFRAAGKPALLTVFRNEGRWDTSNVIFRQGKLLLYDKENPSPEMRYVDYGLGVLTAGALESHKGDQEFDLATVYTDLSKRGELAGFEVTERFYEIGSFAGRQETEEYLRGAHS